MSDYGDQWRDHKKHRDSLFCGYCSCGRKLLSTWSACVCGEKNSAHKPSQAPAVVDSLKAESIQRRATNRERSAALLTSLGVDFKSCNDGAHLIVTHEGTTVDFWPGTGKYKSRAPGTPYGRGVFHMLKLLGVDTKAAKERDQ